MADFSDLKRQVAEIARERVVRASAMMTDQLKRTAPVDTGETKRKTGVELTSATDTRVTAEAAIDVEYAEVIVGGSRPHKITPKRPGGVLRFHWPKAGGVVYFKSVQHPGTAANPFFDQVVSRWREWLERSAN